MLNPFQLACIAVIACALCVAHPIWPLPKSFVSTAFAPGDCIRVSANISIVGLENGGDVGTFAKVRFSNIVASATVRLESVLSTACTHVVATLAVLEVQIEQQHEASPVPQYGVDESYNLTLSRDRCVLQAATIWGALHGLETFVSLVSVSQSTTESFAALPYSAVVVQDAPRFSHRGFLVDTSRRFLTLQTLERIITGLVASKMNVLHFHVTDDQSWPLQLPSFPNITSTAFSPRHLYSTGDIAKLIDFARLRGVRILVEIESPGHSHALEKALPDLQLGTNCPSIRSGFQPPLDVTRPTTLRAMQLILRDVVSIFPDHFIHIGGDEVNGDCWQDSPDVSKYMRDNNISSPAELQFLWEVNITAALRALRRIPIIWEGNFGSNTLYPKGAVVQLWKGTAASSRPLMKQLLEANYQVLFSLSSWYLNINRVSDEEFAQRAMDSKMWDYVHKQDPLPAGLVLPSAEKNLLGGSASLWGNFEVNANEEALAFPRAFAAGERLWSQASVITKEPFLNTTARLHALICRVQARGVGASVAAMASGLSPGNPLLFCPIPFDRNTPLV